MAEGIAKYALFFKAQIVLFTILYFITAGKILLSYFLGMGLGLGSQIGH